MTYLIIILIFGTSIYGLFYMFKADERRIERESAERERERQIRDRQRLERERIARIRRKNKVDKKVLHDIFKSIQSDYKNFTESYRVTKQSYYGMNSITYIFGGHSNYTYVKVSAFDGHQSGSIEFQKREYNITNGRNSQETYEWKIIAGEFNQFFKLLNDIRKIYERKKEARDEYKYHDFDSYFNDDFFNDFFNQPGGSGSAGMGGGANGSGSRQNRSQSYGRSSYGGYDAYERQQKQQKQQRQQSQPKKKVYSDKNTEHKRYPLYTKLRETVDARDAQLKKMKKTYPDFESLTNERNAAKLKMDTLKKKYEF